MEVLFDDPALQKVFENEKKLIRKFGGRPAKVIGIRMAALEAAANVLELKPLPGKWHELAANKSGTWACSLVEPYRLEFRPQAPTPETSTGGIDWGLVTTVYIVEVSKHYGH